MKGKHIKLPDANFTPAFITADDVISESARSLADMLAEAQAKALKEGIKANTVIIDEHFAKVNAFDFVFGRAVMSLPPMICGLEVQVSDEFPDGYDFIVLEAPETERERLIARAKLETAMEIFAEIESEIVAALQSNYRAKQERVEKQLPDDFVSYMCEGKIAALRGIEAFVEELKEKYTEGGE
jgi:hypothetical protein